MLNINVSKCKQTHVPKWECQERYFMKIFYSDWPSKKVGSIEGQVGPATDDWICFKISNCPIAKSNSRNLRLAIHLLLCSEWEAICTFLAIVCSSWTPVNRGSTGRGILTPLGNEDFVAVRRSNKLVSRPELCNFFPIQRCLLLET